MRRNRVWCVQSLARGVVKVPTLKYGNILHLAFRMTRETFVAAASRDKASWPEIQGRQGFYKLDTNRMFLLLVL